MTSDFVFVDSKRAKHITLGNFLTIFSNIQREHPEMQILMKNGNIVGRMRS